MEKKYIIWDGKHKVFSKRVQEAIGSSRVTRRVVYAGGSVHWYAKCSIARCPNDYNFTQKNTLMSRKEMCQQHANPRLLIDGGLVYSRRILENLDRVVWIDRGKQKKRSAHIKCSTPGCLSTAHVNVVDVEDIRNYACRGCKGSNLRKRPFESTFNQWLRNTSKYLLAKKEKTSLNVTYEQFYAMCINRTNCHYCGVALNRAPYSQKSSIYRKFGASCIDRCDPGKGYTEDNMVPCCGSCNFTKGKWLIPEEMIYLSLIRRGQFRQAFAKAREFASAIKRHCGSLRAKIGHHGKEMLYIGDHQARLMYKDFLRDAARRKTPVSVNLPFSAYSNIVMRDTTCFYCGDSLFRIYKRKNRGLGIRHSLDRIDPRQGYSKKNTISACSVCNLTRGAWISFEEMQIIALVRVGKLKAAKALCSAYSDELLYWGKLTQVFDSKMMHIWLKAHGRRARPESLR